MKKSDLNKLLNGEIQSLKIDDVRTLFLHHDVLNQKVLTLRFDSHLPFNTAILNTFTIKPINHCQIVEEIRMRTEQYFNMCTEYLNSCKVLPNWHE